MKYPNIYSPFSEQVARYGGREALDFACALAGAEVPEELGERYARASASAKTSSTA